MNQKILETSEFQKVKNLVEPYLQTEQGEVELQELAPLAKKEAIETAFLEMAIWLRSLWSIRTLACPPSKKFVQ